ncbi:type VII toxin-antitoxin system MntA family adenylyltransferase antitoxin [Fodinibius sp.]|uniref:type VII toxin-antitoxin system MntA family adenylyltransferase antitoxin n=1 Tax=Fodinibius sp. TaxID=1872440 RepID=UPI002ACEEA0F|nr:nucleotidyltransferase domain-containing protein [Fodinibius sp.]MDZ7659453.1 nucleotidyltransferase domain-containing protein [Fodinibius sp.]
MENDRERLTEVAGLYGLRLVVLYGSYARGAAGGGSDLDIAVLGCPAGAYLDCYQSLSHSFPGHTLDLVRLESADALFRYEIMRDAVLLYGDPDLFCEYRAFAYRDFVDSADLLALEETLSQKKLEQIKEQLYGPS